MKHNVGCMAKALFTSRSTKCMVRTLNFSTGLNTFGTGFHSTRIMNKNLFMHVYDALQRKPSALVSSPVSSHFIDRISI